MAAMLRVRLPSWAACASPTRWSSAGTTCPAGRRRGDRGGPRASPRARRRHAGRRGRPPPPSAGGAVAVADPRRPAPARPAVALRGVAAAGGRPRVERATGHVDVAHATGIVPCRDGRPARRDDRRRGLPPRAGALQPPGAAGDAAQPRVVRDEASLVLASSRGQPSASCEARRDRPRPHPRRPARGGPDAGRRRTPSRDVRVRYSLPRALRALRRHDRAAQEPAPPGRRRRPVRGAAAAGGGRSRRVGRRGDGSSPATCGSSASCRRPTCPRCTPRRRSSPIPSEREGFGLPVAEAMAQGTPVVTSAGTATEEVAGGAAVLVDPLDVDAIAAGLDRGRRAGRRAGRGRPAAGRRADLGRAPPSARWPPTGRRSVDDDVRPTAS